MATAAPTARPIWWNEDFAASRGDDHRSLGISPKEVAAHGGGRELRRRSVGPGSVADAAGIRSGEVIIISVGSVALDGAALLEDLRWWLRRVRPGRDCEIVVRRKGRTVLLRLRRTE